MDDKMAITHIPNAVFQIVKNHGE